MVSPLGPKQPLAPAARPFPLAAAPVLEQRQQQQDQVTLQGGAPPPPSSFQSVAEAPPTPPVAPAPAPTLAAPSAPISLFQEAAPPERFSLLESRGLTLASLGAQQGARGTLGKLSEALRSGQKAPANGYLLVGNSGSGKTSLVRGLAGELHQAGIPVVGVDGSELGVGASPDRARNLFADAAERAAQSPHRTAVVFIDEAEAALRARSTECTVAAAQMNSLLTGLIKEASEAQGRSDVQIVLIGATSLRNAVDLESLKLFPVEIPVNVPQDRQERFEVLTALTASNRYPLGDNSKALLRDVAAATPGNTPLQLENLLGTATRLCGERGGTSLTRADLRDARLENSFGPPRAVNTDEWMFRLAASHELSHAATRHFFRQLATDDQRPDNMPQALDCVTFMPRGTANAAVYLQGAENPAITLGTIVADVTTLYAGKAAEAQFGGGHQSAGPGSDLSSGTTRIQEAVRNYGMAGSNLTSGTGGVAADPKNREAEQRLSDTCDEMSRSLVNFYAEFIGGMAGDVTARRQDPAALTIDGDQFERAIRDWEQNSPERREQFSRLQAYVRRTIDGLTPRPARIYDPVTDSMIEAPKPQPLT